MATTASGGWGQGEYLFDHRNASLRDWLIDDYFFGPNCLGDDNIDGLILDDDWFGSGPTEENSHAVADMGLSATDVAEIGGNWSLTLQRLQQEVLRRGKYVVPGYAGDSMSTRSHNHTQVRSKPCPHSLAAMLSASLQLRPPLALVPLHPIV